MPSHTLAYLSLAFVFAFTPGATTAVVIRHALDGGWRRGLIASLGAITASAIMASLSLAGVSTLLQRWPDGLRIVGTAGAVFLAWMGLKSLRAMLAPARTRPHPSAPVRTSSRPYREGFAINILNPSVLSFYVGVTPTFLDPDSTWRGLLGLYAAHLSVVLGCHTFWAVLFNQARGFFTGERRRRWLDGAVGVILLWLSYRVASRW
ncbi:MAG: LysE family translocator [Acidobacteriota bacterium]